MPARRHSTVLTADRPVPDPGRFLAALILSALTFYVAILNVGAPMGRPWWLSPAGPPAGRLITVPKARDAATDTASLTSTGNTTLAGAQVFGKTVDVTVGGQLGMTSLQDQETQSQNQSSFGLSASIPIFGAGATPPGGSISGQVSHGTGSSNSVSDPSGIFAGDGAFHINVGGTTTCEGCYFTSSAAAAAANLNSLNTGSLVDIPINNSSSSKVSSVGGTLSVGVLPGATGFIPDPIQNQNSSASSVTAGGVTQNANGKTITVANPADQGAANALAANSAGLTTQNVTSRDGALAALPNIAGEVGDQQQVAQAFAVAAPAIGQTEGQIANALQAQWAQNNPGADPNTNPYNEGGIGRVALQAAGGALLGGLGGGTALSALGGATGAAAAQLAEPTLQQLIFPGSQPGALPQGASPLSYLGMNLASGLVGGVAGGAAGAAAASTFEEYNLGSLVGPCPKSAKNCAIKDIPTAFVVSNPSAGYAPDNQTFIEPRSEVMAWLAIPDGSTLSDGLYVPPSTISTPASATNAATPTNPTANVTPVTSAGPTANVTPVNQVSANPTDSTSNPCGGFGCVDSGSAADQADLASQQKQFQSTVAQIANENAPQFFAIAVGAPALAGAGAAACVAGGCEAIVAATGGAQVTSRVVGGTFGAAGGALTGYNQTGNLQGTVTGALVGGVIGAVGGPAPEALAKTYGAGALSRFLIFTGTNAGLGGVSAVATSEAAYLTGGGQSPDIAKTFGLGFVVGGLTSGVEGGFAAGGLLEGLEPLGKLVLTVNTNLYNFFGTIIATCPGSGPNCGPAPAATPASTPSSNPVSTPKPKGP